MSTGPQSFSISPIEVSSYLENNLDFFKDFHDLALKLQLPREQGATTSLASYQIQALRDKNQALGKQLQELIGIAAENEQLILRVHLLTLGLMKAATLRDTLNGVLGMLKEDLKSDAIRVVLFGSVLPEIAMDHVSVLPKDHATLAHLSGIIAKGEPFCGRLEAERLRPLFGEEADSVKSSVLMPILPHGLVAIGSCDANRYHPGMGTLFLKLMIETIVVALGRFSPSKR